MKEIHKKSTQRESVQNHSKDDRVLSPLEQDMSQGKDLAKVIHLVETGKAKATLKREVGQKPALEVRKFISQELIYFTDRPEDIEALQDFIELE